MNSLLLLLVVCPLLGSAVFISVIAVAFTIASLPRVLHRHTRALARRAASEG